MAEQTDPYLTNPFLGLLYQQPEAPLSTGQRLARLAVKGAGLGIPFQETQAEGLLEHGVEFAAGVPTVVGLSALGSPAVAAGARLMKLAEPGVAASRLITAGGIGTISGGGKALATGDISNVPTDVAWNVGTEAAFLGAGKLLRNLKGVPERAPDVTPSTPSQKQDLQSTIKATTVEVSDTPPVPIKFGPQMDMYEQMELPNMPTKAMYGPRIDVDSVYKQRISEQSQTPFNPYPDRVTLDNYVSHPQVRDLSESVDVEPGKLFQVTTTNFGERPPRTDIVEAETLKKMFEVRISPESDAPELIPLSKTADDLIKALRGQPELRQVEMQFDAGQLDFFGREQGRGFINKYNADAMKRDMMKTSEIVKLPEETVQKIVDDATSVTKISDTAVIKKSKDGKFVDDLAAKNDLKPEEMSAFVRQAEEIIAARPPYPDARQKKLATRIEILKLLNARCRLT